MNITVAGGKGGIGKTTTSMYVAAGLFARGHRVGLIDADPHSQSAYDWYTLSVTAPNYGGYGEVWPTHVYPWASPDVARRRRQLVRDGIVSTTVTDTGGGAPAIFAASLHDGGELLVPVRPNFIELRRLPATFTAAQEVAQTTGNPVHARVLLVAVNTSARDADVAREWLANNGMPVMAAQVRQSVQYPRAFGHWPGSDLGDYAEVVDELLSLAVAA